MKVLVEIFNISGLNSRWLIILTAFHGVIKLWSYNMVLHFTVHTVNTLQSIHTYEHARIKMIRLDFNHKLCKN